MENIFHQCNRIRKNCAVHVLKRITTNLTILFKFHDKSIINVSIPTWTAVQKTSRDIKSRDGFLSSCG